MTTVPPPNESPEEAIGRLTRRAERERLARKAAEQLLDEKSRALFESNRALESAHKAQVSSTE